MNDETQNIINYLNDKMNAEERTAFETRLQNNPELAEEVEIYRGLQGFLQRDDADLNQKLEKLGNEFANKKAKRSFLPIIISILSVVIIVVIYLTFFANKATESLNNDTTQQTIDTAEQIENNPIFEEKDTTSPNPFIPSPTNETPQKIDKSQPIASLNEADFKANPILENLIAKNVRDNNATLTMIIEPLPNVNFDYQKTINFKLKGTTNAQPAYRLKLYSNKNFEIENDYTILNELIKNKQNSDNFEFQFNANIPLKRGLYYFIIQQEENEEVLYISKFTVK